MKSALLVAVVLCAVCCSELVNGSIAGFKNPDMEAVAYRLLDGMGRMKVGLMGQMNQFSSPAAIRTGLASYETLMINVMAAKPDCVTKEMHTVAPDAITQFQKCLPDQATLKARMEKGQQVIEDLLNKLRDVDDKMQAVSDPVLKAQMVALADVENVGAFCLDVTHQIFAGMAPILTCTQNAATNLRDTLLTYISQVKQCYGNGQ